MESKILSSGFRHSSLPKSYIQPESDRPRLSEVSTCENVPVIDLGSGDRTRIIHEIAHACSFYGFFMVVNHEVPNETVESMFKVSKEFFKLPLEEKMKLYSEDMSKTVKLSTSFNVKNEKVHNWRDCLRLLQCHPLEKYVHEWPSNPSSFKQIVSRYCKEVRELAFRLEDLISESLGLEKDHIRNLIGEQEQSTTINLYPACPEPDLTYGLATHTDPHAVTILLPDPEVGGLQVLKDGKWIAVNPIPGALIINIGDQLQALSNGRYQSVWHRVVVNSEKERMSIGSFFGPSRSTIISPPKSLINDRPKVVYRDFTYGEYRDLAYSRGLDRVQCLEFFKTK